MITKCTSVVTILILSWNLFGWTAYKLVHDHVNQNSDVNYCKVSICSCEIHDTETVCSCHHKENSGNENHENKLSSDRFAPIGFCALDTPPTPSPDKNLPGIIIHQHYAYLIITPGLTTYPAKRTLPFSSSEKPENPFADNLLRPPIFTS